MQVHLEDFIHQTVINKLKLSGIVVRQHGEVVGSFYWDDCYERRMNINSCTKSVLSLAVGIAEAEGILSLDEKVASAFEAELPVHPQPELWQLTIRNMLMMSTGHNRCLLPRVGRDHMPESNWVRHLLAQPLSWMPGSQFQYNNMGPYLCSVLIQRRTGQTLLNWLKPRLFDPLEIHNPQWFQCPMGYTAGMGGLFLTPEELSRLGQLCLDHGSWQGRQLVPAAYLEQATARQIGSDYQESPTPDFQAGYGYHFWCNARFHSYRGWGNNGQNMIVLPEQDAVVAITAADSNTQGILNAVWDTIVPQL